MNFVQTEMTWLQGMAGMTNGMVPIKISHAGIIASQGEKLSHQICCGNRRGMKGMTNGMVVAFCEKGSSI